MLNLKNIRQYVGNIIAFIISIVITIVIVQPHCVSCLQPAMGKIVLQRGMTEAISVIFGHLPSPTRIWFDPSNASLLDIALAWQCCWHRPYSFYVSGDLVWHCITVSIVWATQSKSWYSFASLTFSFRFYGLSTPSLMHLLSFNHPFRWLAIPRSADWRR